MFNNPLPSLDHDHGEHGEDHERRDDVTDVYGVVAALDLGGEAGQHRHPRSVHRPGSGRAGCSTPWATPVSFWNTCAMDQQILVHTSRRGVEAGP